MAISDVVSSKLAVSANDHIILYLMISSISHVPKRLLKRPSYREKARLL